ACGEGKGSDSLVSNAPSSSFASSALSLFLAARAPCAQVVALSPDCRLAISPTSRSRRAADSSDERKGVLAALAAARVQPLPSPRGGNPNSPDPAPVLAALGGGVQRSGASRSSSPAMPTSVNRA